MELINFQGLNCYLNCVVTLAAGLGADYPLAFAGLWGETELKHDGDFFSTRRVPEALSALGAEIQLYPCESCDDIRKYLELYPSEPVIVGADTHYLPWTPGFGTVSYPHYFIACRDSSDEFFCYDPTYGVKKEPLGAEVIYSHGFYVIYLRKTKSSAEYKTQEEAAEEVLRVLPDFLGSFTAQIRECRGENRSNAVALAKFADTLLNNRFLYKYYLERYGFSKNIFHLFFEKEFYGKWRAVKNGLYKMSVVENNGEVIEEVCGMLGSVINEEIKQARDLVAYYLYL